MTDTDVIAPAQGEGTARCFKLKDFQSLSTASLRTAQVTVTRVRAGAGETEMTEKAPSERAFVIGHQLADLPYFELWKQGHHHMTCAFAKATTSCIHLEEEPQAYLPQAYDGLILHMPELALRELAQSGDFPVFDKIMDDRHTIDAVTATLAGLLLPALARPEAADQIFVDHVLTAICAHLLASYSSRSRPPADSGTLTPLQTRTAMDRMSASLSSDISLADVAAACDMPLVTFSRAFRRTVGLAPYQWLQQYRLDAARRLLAETNRPIADIAQDCGFSDQSHLTRAFRAAFGTTPRQHRLVATT